MQELILTYISHCMNSEEGLHTGLYELPNDQITNEMIEAREASKDLKNDDRISLSENNHAI